jgi:hypothetical protein
MSTVIRELDACVFCGATDMTEEHLIADWAHRAFAQRRRPTGFFRGSVVDSALQLHDDDPIVTAQVICRSCNNGWVSRIDNAASQVLRPLIRGQSEVALARDGQTAVAAWVYKTAWRVSP